MNTIKVDSDTLLVLANDIYNFKDGLSRFALDVGKIEDRIALIVDVNVYKLKNELAYLMNCTYLFSREFENLAEGLHYASIEYQDADKRIKDSIGSMTKLHMNDIASLIKNGVGIPLPLFVPNEYADYEEYLISEDEAKKYFTMGILGTGIVNGLKAKTMPAKISYKKDGHLYVYALCEAPEINPIFGKEIRIPHDGLDSKMIEQITNYKYQQVYTNEPKIERLDGVMPFDGGVSKVTSSKATISNQAVNPRSVPGIASGGENLTNPVRAMKGSNGNIGVIPLEVANNLRGREFNNFDEFRKAFWEEYANSSYASNFSKANIKRMEKGLAPKAPASQQYGKITSYVIHHKIPIYNGGGVYDLGNILISSPRMHQEILYKRFHFNK